MSLTPYAAAKLVNAALSAHGIEKVLPPQMFYNYTKGQVSKGKNPLIEFDRETGKIEERTLQVWLVKYLAKKGVKVEPVNTRDEIDDAYLIDVEN